MSLPGIYYGLFSDERKQMTGGGGGAIAADVRRVRVFM